MGIARRHFSTRKWGLQRTRANKLMEVRAACGGSFVGIPCILHPFEYPPSPNVPLPSTGGFSRRWTWLPSVSELGYGSDQSSRVLATTLDRQSSPQPQSCGLSSPSFCFRQCRPGLSWSPPASRISRWTHNPKSRLNTPGGCAANHQITEMLR
jgi:hypothetical protein